MSSGRRWIIRDRDNNQIYLTEERWQHIVDPDNHLEMIDYEEHLKTTIQRGYRRQEPLNLRKYRYVYPFYNLPDGSNHVVAIVLFSFDVDEAGNTTPNNYITTAFFKHIRLKGARND